MLFNEPKLLKSALFRELEGWLTGFSALQRAEIAEIVYGMRHGRDYGSCFSALQRAEIAEMRLTGRLQRYEPEFQCSSTSRNC